MLPLAMKTSIFIELYLLPELIQGLSNWKFLIEKPYPQLFPLKGKEWRNVIAKRYSIIAKCYNVIAKRYNVFAKLREGRSDLIWLFLKWKTPKMSRWWYNLCQYLYRNYLSRNFIFLNDVLSKCFVTVWCKNNELSILTFGQYAE